MGSGEEAGMAVSPPEAGCLEGSPLCVAASAQLEEKRLHLILVVSLGGHLQA